MTERRAPAPPPDGLMDLFGVAEAAPAPRAVQEPGDDAARWSSVTRSAGLCTLCVRAIHARADGPHPLKATARRQTATDDLDLCPAHAQTLREQDEKAKKRRKEREKLQGGTGSRKAGRRREHA